MPFEVIPDAELRLHLLGIFYRVAQTRDRRGGDPNSTTHHLTGLPDSAADLLGRSDGVSGKALAMELVVRPEDVATSFLRRPPAHKALKYIPKDEWTDVEENAVEDFTLQVKALVHKLTESDGYFVLEIPGGNPYDPDEALACGDDGMTRAFRITFAGLKAAFTEVPGTPMAEVRGLKDDVGKTIYDETPQWHKDEVK